MTELQEVADNLSAEELKAKLAELLAENSKLKAKANKQKAELTKLTQRLQTVFGQEAAAGTVRYFHVYTFYTENNSTAEIDAALEQTNLVALCGKDFFMPSKLAIQKEYLQEPVATVGNKLTLNVDL